MRGRFVFLKEYPSAEAYAKGHYGENHARLGGRRIPQGGSFKKKIKAGFAKDTAQQDGEILPCHMGDERFEKGQADKA